MKELYDWIEKHPIWVLVMMIIGIPGLILAFFLFAMLFSNVTGVNLNKYTELDNMAWLGFWGSYTATITTIIVLYITTKQTRDIQNKIDEQNKLQLRLSYEPMLTFGVIGNSWEIGQSGLVLTIGHLINIGKDIAKDIKIKIDVAGEETAECYIPLLSKEQEASVKLYVGNGFSYSKSSYKIRINYKDMMDYEYCTTYCINDGDYIKPVVQHERK